MMPILAWILLGLIAGFLGSKLVLVRLHHSRHNGARQQLCPK